jgi:Fe2+ or Zn2+ uptake regulation protein
MQRELGVPFDYGAEERLREAGVRATKQRRALIMFLATTHQPQTVQQILDGVQPRIDQATIYRMLQILRDAGLVRQIDFYRGNLLYELSDPMLDHHHVVCKRCSRVEDFVGCDYEKIAETALKQVRGFAAIDSHSFELFGVCKECAQ